MARHLLLFRSGDRLGVHQPDHIAVAGDQYLSADLDDPALLHELQGEQAERAAALARPGAVFGSVRPIPDIWHGMQVTARFVVSIGRDRDVLGFMLAYLIDRKFRGHGFWTTVILVPMMLSPAVVGNFWTFLYQPQSGLFNYIVGFFLGVSPSSFQMIGDVTLGARSIVIVDVWMWTPYACSFASPDFDRSLNISRGGRSGSRVGIASILVDHVADVVAVHHAPVLFRGIENFKMFDMVNLLTNGGPGSTTELASITLKREAFEKWTTGYASAFAVILFVTIFGLANIYVRALNQVKQK